MRIISKIESIIAGFYIHKLYLIVLAVLLFFALYGVLINWRPYATGGLFSIEWLETTPEK